jgi:hypothetical protein
MYNFYCSVVGSMAKSCMLNSDSGTSTKKGLRRKNLKIMCRMLHLERIKTIGARYLKESDLGVKVLNCTKTKRKVNRKR